MVLSLIVRRFEKTLKRANARMLARDGEAWFLDEAKTADQKRVRGDLLRGFRGVGEHVKCAHSDMEMLRIADFLLASPSRDPVIECGCFKGGMTAKISLVCRVTGRKLLVCDSFEGLPAPTPEDAGLTTMHNDPYAKGMFAGCLDEVRHNVSTYGAGEVCEYRVGFFEKTLPRLEAAKICCAFVDVDLISSARDCLRNLWPRLSAGGRIFFHEARDRRFVCGITDPTWWRQELGEWPPQLVGAFFGCGDAAPQLAYWDKGLPAAS